MTAATRGGGPRTPSPAADIARRLARQAEAVCRHYLPEGRREGRYWLVGDVNGVRGRSLYVRLGGGDGGERAAGKWSDAATGEHGDLLDLIAANQRCPTLRATLAEARRFLSLPRPASGRSIAARPATPGSPAAAARLWALARPIAGTLAARYLHGRDLIAPVDGDTLRFLDRCWYRPGRDDAPGTATAWPAMIAAVRDRAGVLTGVHRTWIDPASCTKAPVATPRRAMGQLAGQGVWFGAPGPVLIAGEGIETILSLRQILPRLPMVAALSAHHLAALRLPDNLQRLYLARDNDAAGHAAVGALGNRAQARGIDTRIIATDAGDFNDALRRYGRDGLVARVRGAFLPEEIDSLDLGEPRRASDTG